MNSPFLIINNISQLLFAQNTEPTNKQKDFAYEFIYELYKAELTKPNFTYKVKSFEENKVFVKSINTQSNRVVAMTNCQFLRLKFHKPAQTSMASLYKLKS